MSDTVHGAKASPATEQDREERDEKIAQAKEHVDAESDAREGAAADADGAKPPPDAGGHPHRWWHRHLEPEERQRVLAELGIKPQPHWAFRFSTMLGLSVVVAVMGLSADSAAVVIGAMLLAPLMQPVLATAACISMGLFRKSLRAAWNVLLASVGSIALSYVLAWLFVTGDLPSEVTSRVAPDIRDLVVALGAGTAGAYATVRRDVSASLPGVAVAVALVPPLGVVGITLEAGELSFARGALLLYVTNLAAIVLVASIVFVATGLVPPRRLARTFRRTAAVAAVVGVVVVAIAIPLYRASLSAAEQTERELEALDIVDTWLGPLEPVDREVNFRSGQRIQVRVRSFDAPIDDRPLTEAMQARFGAGRVVSLEWDRLARFEEPDPSPSSTDAIDESATPIGQIEAIVDEWLAGDESTGTRRVDALVIGDGIVRIDASGVGEAPSLPELTDLLDDALDETFEVQLTWVERQSVNAAAEATTDELLIGQATVIADAWADTNDVSLGWVEYGEGRAVVELTGEERPDVSDLLDDLTAVFPADTDVTILFIERLDITTTETTTSATG